MLSPEDLAKSGTEHGHQSALFLWAAIHQSTFPELALMFAIPNGGLRGKATAAVLKAEGVKAGVPDIFLPVARNGFHGLFIEMKKENGKLSKEQKEFGLSVRERGYAFRVCYSWIEARDKIISYLT